MTDTPNLNLPYLLAAQAQKHVTHNEALRALDCVVQLSVLDRNLATPPVSPANGARYLVAASPTGAWTGQAGKIAAFQDSAWMFFAPNEGWLTWVADENILLVHDGAVWVAPPGGGGVTDHGLLTGLADDDHPQYHTNARGDVRYMPIAPATLGINATADTINRLALGSAASLFNHAGTGGHQVKVNKATATDTASFLFQTGFSGRAEIGTTGDDDFHFKVSPNGSTWFEAIKVDETTGRVTLPSSDFDVQVYSTAGTYTWTKPVWANANAIVEVHLLGGGGGGGAGRRGAVATVRCGGGGGGGGAYTTIKRKALDFAATETVVVGAGGNGGAATATDNSNGASGATGGTSTFGILRAVGGNAGAGGTAATGTGGAVVGTTTPFTMAALAGAAASTSGAAGVTSVGSATGMPTGGGSGGGVTAADAVSGGGGSAVTVSYFSNASAAGAAVSTAGGAGNAATNSLSFAYGVAFGCGGGGGGSSTTAAAGAGGTGINGGGGGGGAASLNSFASGAGGKGGDGWVVAITYR